MWGYIGHKDPSLLIGEMATTWPIFIQSFGPVIDIATPNYYLFVVI
jgi:hypothetical protein